MLPPPLKQRPFLFPRILPKSRVHVAVKELRGGELSRRPARQENRPTQAARLQTTQTEKEGQIGQIRVAWLAFLIVHAWRP
jgi:hypothetical protein